MQHSHSQQQKSNCISTATDIHVKLNYHKITEYTCIWRDFNTWPWVSMHVLYIHDIWTLWFRHCWSPESDLI